MRQRVFLYFLFGTNMIYRFNKAEMVQYNFSGKSGEILEELLNGAQTLVKGPGCRCSLETTRV